MANTCKYCPVFTIPDENDLPFDLFVEAMISISSSLSTKYKTGMCSYIYVSMFLNTKRKWYYHS